MHNSLHININVIQLLTNETLSNKIIKRSK
jgi:hypothetical protein